MPLIAIILLIFAASFILYGMSKSLMDDYCLVLSMALGLIATALFFFWASCQFKAGYIVIHINYMTPIMILIGILFWFLFYAAGLWLGNMLWRRSIK